MLASLLLVSQSSVSAGAVAGASQLGVWYFVANGKGTKVNDKSTDPRWVKTSKSAVNFVSLAFVNPHEIYTQGEDALPQAIINHIGSFKNVSNTMIAVGGDTFKNDWTFLKSAADTKKAAAVCAGWAHKYKVGIEVDYEGAASQNGAWSVSWDGVSTVSEELQNLGLFIETLATSIPHGLPVTLDVFATQGGGPSLTWLVNRYVKGMPMEQRPWIKSGDAAVFKTAALSWVNIMVGVTNEEAIVSSYLDGWVGSVAQISTASVPVYVNAGIPPTEATIGLKAGDACAEITHDVPNILQYSRSIQLRGVNFWAVAPYGCCNDCWNSPLHISYWNCSFEDSCPGLASLSLV